MRIGIVVVCLLFARSGVAGPPSGYRCGDGKPRAGVGCVCPAGQLEKRDGDNIATCVAAPRRDPPPPPKRVGPAIEVTEGRILLKEQLQFDLDKVSPISFPVLDEVAAVLVKDRGIRLEIAAHTDSVGADDHNTRVSQGRADSVRMYLVRKGIESSRLTAKGYGETMPIADNRTPAGRAQNRRIELVIARAAINPPGRYTHVTVTATMIETKKPIMFDGGRATFDENAAPIMDEVASVLRDNTTLNIEIQGHTDDGSTPSTVQLAQDRADAVRTYLIGKGIAASRLTARAIGSNQPMSATSRRIDLVIVGVKTATSTRVDPRAQQLYEEGANAYNLADYDLAVDKFKAAYAIDRKPAFLYNIAQSYRLKGDRKLAIEFYERFLADAPNNRQADEVRKRIDELRAAEKNPKRPPPPG